MIANSVNNKISLLFMLFLMGCYSEAPPVPGIDTLEGTYQSPGCQEIVIANGRLRLSSSKEVEVTVVRVKENIYILPSKGVVVEDHACVLGYYKWPQRIEVSKDLSAISILNRSQDKIIHFHRRAENRPN